ncbi:cyclic GMP-AMP synthase-like receptor [Oculina patagonica]
MPSLDLFIRDLDKRKGKIACCQEVADIRISVEKIVKALLLEVEKENPFLKSTLINSGSFYEGTKVGQPDEFDYLVQLDRFSTPRDILFEEHPCSTLLVGPSKSTIGKMQFQFPDGWPYWGRLYVDAFKWRNSIKTPFYEIFNKKAEGFEAFEMKVVLRHEATDTEPSSPPLAEHGPAFTLLLEWNGGEQYKGLRISVDLALAVKINYRPNNVDLEFESPAGRVLKSLFDNMPYYFAVGSNRNVLTEVHPNYFAKYTDTRLQLSNFCLRCSQSCFEQTLFRHEFSPDSGQSKCLRLLKVLRDIVFPDTEIEIKRNSNNSGFWQFNVDRAADCLKNIGKLVSSYVLKTLVLFEWQQNPADELWSGNNLSQRLLSILRSLVAHLKQRKLRSFFYADYNIFPSSITQEMDFLNAASIISILLNGLLSIAKNMNEYYNFEECMKKIKGDSTIVYRKKSFTSLLLAGFWETLFDDSYLKKAVEESLRKEGLGKIYSDEYKKEEMEPGATSVIEETDGKNRFFGIYVQALLDEIAPEETLILTSTNVKDAKCLNQAGQLFKKIARRRMAASQAILPSYSLWSQEHWRLEGSVYEYTTDKPKKLLKFLFDHFQEDIKILLREGRELTDC